MNTEVSKYFRHKVWTIDSVNEQFLSLADAKDYIKGLTANDWRTLMRSCDGDCDINHWVKDDIVSSVHVRGTNSFSRIIKVKG